MRAHPEQGAQLLTRYRDFARGAEIVRHHHEAWDGTGYPAGLQGTGIPFGARVIAVADSFDAMTSDRPYRPGMSVDRAAEILRKGQGQQWDPVVVDALLRILDIRSAEWELPRLQIVSRLPSEVRASA
jgi:HD-GYP domain-containing protein (c-di-GMP phosphodiesterase class II)